MTNTKQHSRTDGTASVQRTMYRSLSIAVAVLVCSWAFFLWKLARFTYESSLYSYITLIPLLSVYLLWTAAPVQGTQAQPFRGFAILLLIMGTSLGLTVGYWHLFGAIIEPQDFVATAAAAFVAFLIGLCGWFLPRPHFRSVLPALSFLIFMIPLPVRIEALVESLLQHGSAPPAYWLFKLVGTPVFKEGMVFQLPGISLQIAPECSGIRSTIVLFITSIVAGKLFLRSPWKRAALAAFVLPLALARNGFRVFTIGELCVRIGPHMIDSDIHHKGGPIFFALSLVPFLLVLYFLVKSERSVPLVGAPASAPSSHA